MFAHLAVATLFLIAGRLFLCSWGAGAFAACAWALSRELAQAEYRWIEQFGNGVRANMPWWGGFDSRVWRKADPWLDVMGPIAFSVAAGLLGWRLERSSKTLSPD